MVARRPHRKLLRQPSVGALRLPTLRRADFRVGRYPVGRISEAHPAMTARRPHRPPPPRVTAGRALIPCNFECSGRRVPHDLADVVHSSGSAQPEPLGFTLWRGKHTGTRPGISGFPAPGHNGGTSSGAPMTPTLPIRRRTRSKRCSTDRPARQLAATGPQQGVTPRNWRQVAERLLDLPLWMIGTR